MASNDPDDRRTVAQIASAARWGTCPDATLEDRHRRLVVNRLAEYVTKLVANAPPLTEADRERIAALLIRPTSTGGN
jgi:hypothetical protein